MSEPRPMAYDICAFCKRPITPVRNGGRLYWRHKRGERDYCAVLAIPSMGNRWHRTGGGARKARS